MPLQSRVRVIAKRISGGSTWFLLAGVALFCLGGAGNLLYHLLPVSRAMKLELLLGADAARAHLLTFIGMVVIVIAVLYRGMRHESHRRA